MSGNQKLSNDARWQDVLATENTMAQLATMTERVEVALKHALYADHVNPDVSLERIAVEMTHLRRELKTFRVALAALNEHVISDIRRGELQLVKRAAGE